MNKLSKKIYIAAGFLALGLGWLGVILPVFPTTPFLLLASFCFAKGSDKFDKWFKGTNIYKKYLESYVKTRSMTLKQKWTILLFAYFMMLFPLIFVDKWKVKIIIIAVMILKFYYLVFNVKTADKEPNSCL